MKNLLDKCQTNENLFIDVDIKPRDIKSLKTIADKSYTDDALFINIERKPVDSESLSKNGKILHS